MTDILFRKVKVATAKEWDKLAAEDSCGMWTEGTACALEPVTVHVAGDLYRKVPRPATDDEIEHLKSELELKTEVAAEWERK